MPSNTKSLLQTLKSAKKSKEVNDDLNKDLVLRSYEVDMSEEMDKKTIEFLKTKTFELHSVKSKAYTQIGNIFLDVQQELSKNRYGVFDKWIVSIGYNKAQVNRMINRTLLIKNNTEKASYIEALPITLSYEISAPKCPAELRDAVLDGTITSLKDFKEHKQLIIEEDESLRGTEIDITPITPKLIYSKMESGLRIYKRAKKILLEKNYEEDELIKVNKEFDRIANSLGKLLEELEKN